MFAILGSGKRFNPNPSIKHASKWAADVNSYVTSETYLALTTVTPTAVMTIQNHQRAERNESTALAAKKTGCLFRRRAIRPDLCVVYVVCSRGNEISRNSCVDYFLY